MVESGPIVPIDLKFSSEKAVFQEKIWGDATDRPQAKTDRPINYSSAELEEEELRERPSVPRRWLPALRPERLGAELEREDFVDVDLRAFIKTSLAALSFSKFSSRFL
ncbi:MAG: hypothetical protein ACXWC9_01825 [Pseudobdellovibrionaceae bacterium]